VNEALLVSTFGVPLVLAALWTMPTMRRLVARFTPWAPLPALLLLVATAEPFAFDAPWLLLGARFGLDETGRVLLAFTAVLWLAAGVFARSYLAHDVARYRFDVFYLLTMAGNLGVIVAQDMVSFLLLYTLMSLAAYGLIVHDRQPASMQAGRTYIVLTIFGEVLLFWAAVLAARDSGTLLFDGLADKLAASPHNHVMAGLVLVGFGIKLGVMPLHFWLPLAHPAAPTPASAVLSGAMIKVGLLGMLRFLPLGAAAMPGWGGVCIVAGLFTAICAVAFGLPQRDPKTVLAYSSVSQMGLVAVGVGAALVAPTAFKTILSALLVFVTHHALAKGALFLGVGVASSKFSKPWQRALVTAGLAIAALSLAGLPLTTGFAAKTALKYAATHTPDTWSAALATILPFTGLSTTLLVLRLLWLVRPANQHAHEPAGASMIAAWATLVAAVPAMFWVWRWQQTILVGWVAISPSALWSGIWPLLLGAAIVAVAISRKSLTERLSRIRIPAGDIVVPLNAAARRSRIWSNSVIRKLSDWTRVQLTPNWFRMIDALAGSKLVRIISKIERWTPSGILLCLLTILLFLLLSVAAL
jgi:formate hydrogenlyase subunit 3/multisubunit Na+/H+ antiporter MnhD subunit